MEHPVRRGRVRTNLAKDGLVLALQIWLCVGAVVFPVPEIKRSRYRLSRVDLMNMQTKDGVSLSG
jgi:hypothetical protein